MWPRRYRFEIDDELEEPFAAGFEGMSMRHEGGRTVLTGTVRDQAHLQALLLSASRLGLGIQSITTEEAE